MDPGSQEPDALTLTYSFPNKTKYMDYLMKKSQLTISILTGAKTGVSIGINLALMRSCSPDPAVT